METTPLPTVVPAVMDTLAPTQPPPPEVTTPKPDVLIATLTPTEAPSTDVPKDSFDVTPPNAQTLGLENLVLTTTPAPEPTTVAPIGGREYEYTPPQEHPWFPKLYMIIDAPTYRSTGKLRCLSVLGNVISVEPYRERDLGQCWFTNFKGYVKNASAQTLLTAKGDCAELGLTETYASSPTKWDFQKVHDEDREYHVVAQCGRRLMTSEFQMTATLDPIGSSWFVVPVASVRFQ